MEGGTEEPQPTEEGEGKKSNASADVAFIHTFASKTY